MSQLRIKQNEFAIAISKFILWLTDQGYTVQKGDAWRSTDKLFVPTGKEGFEDDDQYTYQELLFYNRRSKVPYSKHNDRLAQDLNIWKDDQLIQGEALRPLGEKWESMGGRWGGRFGLKLVDGKWVNKNGQETIGWDAFHFEWI